MLIAQLRAGGHVEFVAHGGSMWPAVRAGARLRVVPCGAEQIARGDLVAFARNGALVVHRCIGHTGQHLRVRGDALASDDPPVAHADVLGRAVVLGQPGLRWRLPGLRDLRRLVRALRQWVFVRRDGHRR